MLCGYLHLYSALKAQSFCATLWQNAKDSILLSLFTKFFISSHQLIKAKLLQLLPVMLEETDTAFSYQESGLHMVRIVSTIKVHESGTH